MEQDFVFCQQREDCNNLILFVHGFVGDAEKTWCNLNGNAFPAILLENDYINENFDVASYNYFTTLFDLFADSKEKVRRLRDMIWKRTHKKERNLDIDELSNNLSNHLRFTLEQYDNIYVVAHSMGGLVTKSLIANEIRRNGATKVRLFVSLAVPHQGASLSVIGSLISSNLQISNLNPVEKFIVELNRKWVALDLKPPTKYFYGSYDTVVTKHSAVAIDKIKTDIVSVTEDHNSISKPENSSSIVCISVIQFIVDQHKNTQLSAIGFQQIPENNVLDNELFVIKLILADVADETQQHAKELFFNAEYVRKLFSSKYDKVQLKKLFENIRQLYKDSYDNYLADGNVNSGMLLAEVHTKITAQDSALLKSLIPALQTYHKKGMLHLMANDVDNDVWWSRERNITIKNEQQ
jgi:hypothetical protein